MVYSALWGWVEAGAILCVPWDASRARVYRKMFILLVEQCVSCRIVGLAFS